MLQVVVVDVVVDVNESESEEGQKKSLLIDGQISLTLTI